MEKKTVNIDVLAWVDGDGKNTTKVAWIDGKVTPIVDRHNVQVVGNISKLFPKNTEASPRGEDEMTKLSYLHEPDQTLSACKLYEEETAATRIQKNFRCYVARKSYTNFKHYQKTQDKATEVAWIDGDVACIDGHNVQVVGNISKSFPNDTEASPRGEDEMTKLSYLHEPDQTLSACKPYEEEAAATRIQKNFRCYVARKSYANFKHYQKPQDKATEVAWVDGEVTRIHGHNVQVVGNISKLFPKDTEASPRGEDELTKLSYLHEPDQTLSACKLYEEEAAATRIQKNFRCYIARKSYANFKHYQKPQDKATEVAWIDGEVTRIHGQNVQMGRRHSTCVWVSRHRRGLLVCWDGCGSLPNGLCIDDEEQKVKKLLNSGLYLGYSGNSGVFQSVFYEADKYFSNSNIDEGEIGIPLIERIVRYLVRFLENLEDHIIIELVIAGMVSYGRKDKLHLIWIRRVEGGVNWIVSGLHEKLSCVRLGSGQHVLPVRSCLPKKSRREVMLAGKRAVEKSTLVDFACGGSIRVLYLTKIWSWRQCWIPNNRLNYIEGYKLHKEQNASICKDDDDHCEFDYPERNAMIVFV